MTRIQTGSSSARYRQAITRAVQKQALRAVLKTKRELTVVEVANLHPPIPGLPPGDVNQAMSLTSEYNYDWPKRLRKDLIPGGTIRVVCYEPTSRADRRTRA